MSKVCVLILLTAFLLVVNSQSTDSHRNKSSQSFRQTDSPSVGALIATLSTVLLNGRVAPLLAPVLIKFLVIPLLAIIRSVAKGFLFIGVLGYLFSALVPVFLSYFGMYSSYNFGGRTHIADFWAFAYINDILVPKITALTKSSLNLLQLNGDGCVEMLSCKAGEAMAENFPGVINFWKRYGIIKLLDASFIGDNQTLILVSAMAGENDCNPQRYVCRGVDNLERIFGSVDQHFYSMVTTTTTSIPPVSTDHNSLSELLKVVAHTYLEMQNSTARRQF